MGFWRNLFNSLENILAVAFLNLCLILPVLSLSCNGETVFLSLLSTSLHCFFSATKALHWFLLNSLVVEICENSRHWLVKGDFVFLNPSYYMLMLIKENHIICPPSSDARACEFYTGFNSTVHLWWLDYFSPCSAWDTVLPTQTVFFLLFWFSFLILYVFHLERAKVLADIIGGDAITLADLENFHPEDGMILANTTSIGMQPKVDETPVSKVSYHHAVFFCQLLCISLNEKCTFVFFWIIHIIFLPALSFLYRFMKS